jgi:hypothetical protein
MQRCMSKIQPARHCNQAACIYFSDIPNAASGYGCDRVLHRNNPSLQYENKIPSIPQFLQRQTSRSKHRTPARRTFESGSRCRCDMVWRNKPGLEHHIQLECRPGQHQPLSQHQHG